MMRYLSPLRYPGGKAKLAPYLKRLIECQENRPTQYAEPFAGGAGAALSLLSQNVVEFAHINDLNPGIGAFWRSSLDWPSEFCARIMSVPLTIDEWHRQREVYEAGTTIEDFELGFATFFLNRTNRSGILGARPIGGFDQTGAWKIDARFNRDGLCQRIQAVADLRSRMFVTQLEGIDFLQTLGDLASDIFVYADPPYLVQGEGLYMHAFDAGSHLKLAEFLSDASFPWILTYDDDARVTEELYSTGRCATFEIAHTAHIQHVGREAVIYSAQLLVPDVEITNGRVARWVGEGERDVSSSGFAGR